MKIRNASKRVLTAAPLTGAAADHVHAALERMHERDRERVMNGELIATDLHLIPKDLAQRATLRLSAAAGSRFKARR